MNTINCLSFLKYYLLIVCLPGILALQCSPAPKTVAVHPEKWDEIDAYIRKSWPEFVEKKPDFPKPYTYGLNPGTLYYWDFYFHNEGLFLHGYTQLALDNLDCMIFQIEKLGFIPNASGWGEDRTQMPVFSMGVRRYLDRVHPNDTAWLRKAYRAVLTEYRFWTNTEGVMIEDHRTAVSGLQRYSHHADSAALITFYDRVLAGRFHISRDAPVEEKLLQASHRLAEAECMDFTPRFEGRCLDYIPVDLNSFLYGYERNLADLERELGISDGCRWDALAEARANLIDTYCWNEERGLYLDYDFVNGHQSPVASVAGLIPLHVGLASNAQAQRVRDNLPLFESDGGLVVCEISEQPVEYQWGHNAVWAPIQQFAIEAMTRYGFRREAKEIAMRWLNTVTRNYVDPCPVNYPPFKYGDGTRHPGFLWEKYTRSGDINDAEYPCSMILGWTASAYLVALKTVRGK
jgi:alpha,alpha-trehalase